MAVWSGGAAAAAPSRVCIEIARLLLSRWHCISREHIEHILPAGASHSLPSLSRASEAATRGPLRSAHLQSGAAAREAPRPASPPPPWAAAVGTAGARRHGRRRRPAGLPCPIHGGFCRRQAGVGGPRARGIWRARLVAHLPPPQPAGVHRPASGPASPLLLGRLLLGGRGWGVRGGAGGPGAAAGVQGGTLHCHWAHPAGPGSGGHRPGPQFFLPRPTLRGDTPCRQVGAGSAAEAALPATPHPPHPPARTQHLSERWLPPAGTPPWRRPAGTILCHRRCRRCPSNAATAGTQVHTFGWPPAMPTLPTPAHPPARLPACLLSSPPCRGGAVLDLRRHPLHLLR